MQITRRQFLKYVSAAAATMGVSQAEFTKVIETLAKHNGTSVVWLTGQACTGCTMSFVNLYSAPKPGSTVTMALGDIDTTTPDGYDLGGIYGGYDTVGDVLLDVIDLEAHETLQASAGDLAMAHLEPWKDPAATPTINPAVLIVEGAIPCPTNDVWGNPLVGAEACTIGVEPWTGPGTQTEITMRDALVNLVQRSSYVLAVGQCASYGGIPAAYSDAEDPVQDGAWSGAKNVQGACAGTAAASDAQLLKDNGKLINIPGCPPHPDWIYGAIGRLILNIHDANAYPLPSQDDDGRLAPYYSETIHGPGGCSRYQDYNDGYLASRLGEKGCLAAIGCYGMSTHADCAKRGWNSSRHTLGRNMNCIEAGHPCISCTEPGYPFKINTNG